MSDACTRCGSVLPAGAARCGACKKVDLERARAIGRAGVTALADAQRGRSAARVLLYGSLALAFAIVGIEAAFPEATPWRALAESALFAGLIVAGLVALGPGALAASLGGPVRSSHILPALATGVVAGLAGWGWGLALRHWQGPPPPQAPLAVSSLVSIHLVRGLVLEFLARGVTWAAMRRLQSPRATLLATAVQFALVHAIAWRIYDAPSAFVIGLLLGGLREKTGSLAPCLAAHALALGLALTLLS